MVSQFLTFTVFSVLNSMQFLKVVLKGKLERKKQFEEWKWYSKWYGILSVTAKLLLEVGFLWYVDNARTWPLTEGSTLVRCNMSRGHQCWAVLDKP
jgi:hypothetical protein